MTRHDLFDRLALHLEDKAGLARVHPDTSDPEARAVLAGLAGLPSSEQVWASAVQLVAMVAGERLPGVELARRAQHLGQRARTLSERARGRVLVLQLAAYERPVPEEERAFILAHGRSAPFFGKSRVATWIYSLSEGKLYSSKLRGLPPELSPDALSSLLTV